MQRLFWLPLASARPVLRKARKGGCIALGSDQNQVSPCHACVRAQEGTTGQRYIPHLRQICASAGHNRGKNVGGTLQGKGITVNLDGNEYEDVTFNKCTLAYAAAERVKFTDCHFNKCKVILTRVAKERVGRTTATYEAEPSLIQDIYYSIKDGTAS
jgi:hypothetical protein